MKKLTEFIKEARKPRFDTSWFLSDECSRLFNKVREEAPEKAYQIYLQIENTRELWEQYNNLMKSAVRHEDFDPEYCATSSIMDKIVRAGAKKYNECVDSEDRVSRLDKEFKKAVGLLLVYRWEE